MQLKVGILFEQILMVRKSTIMKICCSYKLTNVNVVTDTTYFHHYIPYTTATHIGVSIVMSTRRFRNFEQEVQAHFINSIKMWHFA